MLSNGELLWPVLLTVAVAVGAVVLARPGAALCARLLRCLGHLARRPRAAIVACAGVSFVGSALVATLVHWPVPRYHDEFDHLLGADTFLSGRLANPPHPLWVHFETFHVIHQPTYAPKFPPGQGLALALGRLLGGPPLLGVWLSGALLCGALVWMLQAWLPRRWALLGGLYGVAVFGVATYWTQSYWGGALAAAGGALVFGALPRALARPRWREGAILGLGLWLLAVTRPYEGLVTVLPAGVLVVGWLLGSRAHPLAARARFTLGVLALLAPGLGWIGWHNRAVTGDPLRFPYQEHDAQYAIAPPFLWLEESPAPEYRHPVMEEFWQGWATSPHRESQELAGFLRHARTKLLRLYWFYLGPLATLLLLALPFALRGRLRWLAPTSLALLILALLGGPHCLVHYAAPATALVVMLLFASARRLARWRWRGRPVGRSALLGVLLGTLLLLVAQVVMRAEPHDSWFLERERIAHRLASDGDRHLVLVRYGPDHNPRDEWVFNLADIDAQAVVWARDMGAERNHELLEYDPARRVWLLLVDVGGEAYRLEPYEE